MQEHFFREINEELVKAQVAKRQAILLIAAVLAAALGIALAAGALLGRHVLGSVAVLRRASRRLEEGDLAARAASLGNDELGELALAFNAMAEKIERHERAIEERSSQLNALNQIAIAITSLLSLQDILNEIMRCGIALTGAKASCIAFYDEATARFTQWVTQGLSEHFVAKLSFSPGGLADEAFTRGSHILSNDRPETGHKLSRLAREEGLRCFICLPLTSRERRLGVIYFYRTDRDAFTPTEIELLNTFASLAAQAIENARLYAQVQELARTDALTGLSNRGEFQRQLKDEVERSRRYHRSFSLLMLDIDHFKTVNDSYGHQAGDEVLRAVAARLREQSRPADRVARHGGEEFVVILPEIAGEGALALAERLRAAVADSAVAVTEGRTIPVTISIGVATFPADAGSGTELIAAADTALYAAKQGGRNRISRYEPALGQPTAQG
jgi:diguanylate cyclase (GGDEF)-like protein